MWRLAMANTLNPNKSETTFSPNKEKLNLPLLLFLAYQ